MCHRHQIMLTSSLYGSIGRGLLIGHSKHFNYQQKYHGSEETTHAPQSRHNGSNDQNEGERKYVTFKPIYLGNHCEF